MDTCSPGMSCHEPQWDWLLAHCGQETRTHLHGECHNKLPEKRDKTFRSIFVI